MMSITFDKKDFVGICRGALKYGEFKNNLMKLCIVVLLNNEMEFLDEYEGRPIDCATTSTLDSFCDDIYTCLKEAVAQANVERAFGYHSVCESNKGVAYIDVTFEVC